MGRNNSPGLDILELEDYVLTGRNYWDRSKDLSYDQVSDDMTIAEKVIAKITSQKKARVDLSEDMNQISEKLHKLNQDV